MPSNLNKSLPVVATIGNAAFVQSGVGHLAHAVNAGARFILVILDNPASDDHARRRLPALVNTCGVRFVLEINPCHQDTFRDALNQAADYTRSEKGGIAVIIATRPCILLDDAPRDFLTAPDLMDVPHGCEDCYEGYAVESNPTSIFELAQQVALQQKQA
jgi:indolepyruvate ferredoxin oxidoreductase alpha subunit